MSDCANVEMRELLPDLLAGTVDAATRARVNEHLTACADCASELETLRLVRAAFAHTPAVNVSRVVAALPRPVVAPHGARPPQRMKRWLDWRIAAALTTITVGGLSLAVSQRARPRTDTPTRDSIEIRTPAVSASESGGAKSPRVLAATQDTQASSGSNRRSASTKAQLSFGGGTADLDDASLQALLGALDEIDRAPIAPSAEPDRTPVLPVIKEGER